MMLVLFIVFTCRHRLLLLALRWGFTASSVFGRSLDWGRLLLFIASLERVHIRLRIAVFGRGLSSLLRIYHWRVLFPGIAICLRRKNRLNGIPALLFVNMLGYQLSHRVLHVFKVLQKLLIKGQLCVLIKCVILLHETSRARIWTRHLAPRSAPKASSACRDHFRFLKLWASIDRCVHFKLLCNLLFRIELPES
jgi:hypothetical protein